MIRSILSVVFMSISLISFGQEFVEMTEQTQFGRTGSNRGVAVGDFNNDGLEDIYVSRVSGRNLLYRNLGSFEFEEVGEEFGVASAAKTNASLWFDVDSDGDLDLFLVNAFQQNILYRNDLDTFVNVTGQYGVGTSANSKTAHAADYDNDGDLDLYVTVFFENNILWRNDNGTRFTNVSQQAGIDDEGRSLGAVFLDYDLDGDMDIYQTRDGDDPNLFFRNNGDGTFTESADEVGLWYDGQGMGADIADLNGDARPDIYLTNLYENKLYLSTSDGRFEEVSESAGVDDIGMGWSAFFFDCDNNGLLDIYLANDSYFGVNGQSDIKNKIYINNGDGTFTTPDYTGNIQNEYGTFGAICADFDKDGLLDLVMANHGNTDGNQIFRNVSPGQDFIGFKLTGKSSNINAIGARVHLYLSDEVRVDYVTAGSGYASQASSVVQFGLGQAGGPDSAVIYWPSGRIQTVKSLVRNQINEIEEEIALQQGEVVWTEPPFPTQADDITVYFNAAEGNGALEGFDGEVFAHTGVITNLSPNETSWRHVIGNWGTFDARVLMTKVEDDIYSLSYNIEDFYNVPSNEEVERLAFVFRNVDGSIVGRATDGSDIFTPVFPADAGLLLSVTSPGEIEDINSILTLNDSIELSAQTNVPSTIRIFDNGVEIASSGGTGTIDYTYYPGETGLRNFEFVATTDTDTVEVLRRVYVVSEPVYAMPPVDLEDGITYTDSSYFFQIYAPGKSFSYLLCPANDWFLDEQFNMKITPDSTRFWIELSRDIFADDMRLYQYLVDGVLVPDPYSEIVLDQWNDPFIDQDIMEEFPEFPENTTGIVTYFDENEQDTFDWQYDEEFIKPEKADLVVYELLVRDFLDSHRYDDLLDTLDYLERLGVNAIEFMPVSEFEGNISWGYNPSYHNALDKYYGSREHFKRFVDEAHRRGMAVILDVVYNHTFSLGPLARLYWDAAQFRPTPDNPYLNVVPRHPFNVGYDVDHESAATKLWVKKTLEHWIREYHVDGFRFDLSKGFTQRNSGDDVGFWGRYDASRVAILKDYADFVWSVDPDSYFILEHFADNDEETELANYGMMLWGNISHEFAEAAMGYQSTLEWGDYTVRGWDDPHLVAYMESHDEERMMYRLLNFGDSDGDYNTRDPETALKRVAAASAIFYTVPGPKMLWQFGEVGYDFSINYCGSGTIDDACRTDPKPIRWDYYEDAERRKLFDKTAALIHLKTNYPTFKTRDYTFNDANFFIKYVTLRHPEMDAHVFANFRVVNSNINPRFPYEGTWYEYFSGDSVIVTDLNERIDLGPGEYRIYTSVRITPPGGYFTSTNEAQAALPLEVWPNPVAAGTEIYISWTHETTAESIELISTDGRQVTFNIQSTGELIRIRPSSDIAPGVYVVRIGTDDGLYVGRVVVGG